MRHKKRFLAMACITALCCAGILTGCGESEDLSAAGISGTALTGSEEDAEDAEDMEDTSSVEHGDVIGKVSYAGSDYLTVISYEAEADVDDYGLLDVSTLIAGSTTKYIYVDENTEYFKVEEQMLVSATLDDVTVDAMIVETTSEEDVQQIIILSGNDADNESLTDAKVAEVTSVNEDGTWSLAIYELSSVIAEYEITELTDVAFDNYIDSGVTEDYVMSDADEIQICSNGLLATADETAVTEGDMLIFCGNESGGNTITVYHQTDLEAAEDTLETENGEETGAE